MTAHEPERRRAATRHVRPLVSADLSDLLRIDHESYLPPLRESEAAFLSKMALCRAGSLGCVEVDELCGYAFALPWRGPALVGVAQVLDDLPDNPDVLYIHDLVVAPAHRRSGVASMLLSALSGLADTLRLERFALVAVQGSEPFWARAGFVPTAAFEYVTGVPATRMEMVGRPRLGAAP